MEGVKESGNDLRRERYLPSHIYCLSVQYVLAGGPAESHQGGIAKDGINVGG